MKENSIEDRINNVYCFLNSMRSDFRTGLYYKEDLENLEYILSDYKRLLKENEQLSTEANSLKKENEELKQDRNNNYQMIALAQNEVLGYMQGYEDGKKLKRSAVACVVENQQYYIIKKEIEHYKEYIEKLQKENEELKIIKSAIQTLQINSMEDEKYIVISKGSFLDGSYKHLLDDYIPIQKVKDKIEELKSNPLKIKQNDKYYFKTNAYNKIIISVLQELLKESEDN